MIAIEKAKIEDLSLKNDDNGQVQITGNYALISTKGKVLARQSFNLGYSADIKVTPTAETQKTLDQFFELFQNDLNTTLGLKE